MTRETSIQATPLKLLLLGGTAEARTLAGALVGDPRVEVMTSLAGATKTPQALPGAVRIGGFGGAEAQETYIKNKGFGAVLNATHPFATGISERSARICERLGLPYARLMRPAWEASEADHWTHVPDEAAVADHIRAGSTVFLATGPGSVEAIGPLPGARVLCRRVDATDAPYPHDGGAWVLGRPPFTAADERAFLAREEVDVLVTKNAGGRGGWAKLVAARDLGLPVVMIDRPPASEGTLQSVETALAWVEGLCA